MAILTKSNFYNLLDYSYDIAAFGCVGNLAGRTINFLEKVYKPSILPKPLLIDTKSASVLCGAFIAIDRIVQGIFARFFGDDSTRRSVSAARLFVSFSATFLVNIYLQETYQLTPIFIKNAAAVIGTSIAMYAIVLKILNIYDFRHEIQSS